MLTNDQCIEVAGKVWGCDLEGIKRFKPQIIHEVNSWQGFGRTVEAMFDKDILFGMEFIIENRGKELAFKPNSKCEKYPVIWDGFDPKELIPATHLAAMEALK